jgi:DNA-binding CsgD family transcriptional regulator
MSNAGCATQADESASSDDKARVDRRAAWSATNARQINPMRGTRKLPDLIEDIYDAALEPALWDDVVADINDFIGDAACVVLKQSSSNCAVLLTVSSGARTIDDEMRRRLALVVPHARRALMINKAIEVKRSEAAALADILNGLSAGIFLVDANCSIVHANTAGQQILCADDVLCCIRGRLVARDGQANQILREIFAADGDVASATVASATKVVALSLTAHSGERYVAHVLPLASLARNHTGMAFKAVAALFVRRVELDGRSSGELIARTFELTPAELRVLLAIVEVGGVPETAGRLGVAEATVKTHLKHLFAKTGARRQADLVKLAAGFSNP